MKTTSVGTRIAGGFSVLLLALVILTAVGIVQVNHINSSLTTISDVNSVKERYAINFRGSVHDRSIAVRDVTLVSADELPSVVAHIERLEADYQASAEPLDKLFASGMHVSDEERQQLAKIKAAEAKTMPLVHDVIARQKAGDNDGAKQEVLAQARPAFVEWLAGVNGFIDMEEALNETQGKYARSVGVQSVCTSSSSC
jgi:methyl-accepting chemotaxis protein